MKRNPELKSALLAFALLSAVFCRGGEKCPQIHEPEDTTFFDFRFRGGLSHYDVNDVESRTGGTWGIEGVVPVTDAWGLYGGYKFNHIEGGTQTLASGGVYKVAVGPFSQFGFAALYDFFDDSRGNDLNVSQAKFQLGYKLNDCWSVGVRMSTGIEDDVDALFYRPGNFTGTWNLNQTSSAFVSGYLGNTLIGLTGGRVHEFDRFYADVSLRHPINEKLFGFVDGQYLDNGSTTVIVGFELRFGRGSCKTSTVRSPWDDPTIAHIFNSGEARTFGGPLDHGTSDASAAAPQPIFPPPW